MKSIKKTKILFIAVILAFSSIVFTGCSLGTEEIKTEDLFKSSGYNYSGEIEKNMDLFSELQEQLKIKNLDTEEMIDKTKGILKFEKAFKDAKFELSGDKENGELKNGDEVEIKITCNEEMIKDAGYNLSSTTFKFMVQGLDEPTKINPFDEELFICKEIGINGEGTIQYKGVDGSGNYEDNSDDTEDNDKYLTDIYGLNYSFDKEDNLKNGDKIKVTATLENNSGYIFDGNKKKLDKNITITNLVEIPDDISKYDTTELDDLFMKAYNDNSFRKDNLEDVWYTEGCYLEKKEIGFFSSAGNPGLKKYELSDSKVISMTKPEAGEKVYFTIGKNPSDITGVYGRKYKVSATYKVTDKYDEFYGDTFTENIEFILYTYVGVYNNKLSARCENDNSFVIVENLDDVDVLSYERQNDGDIVKNFKHYFAD